MTNSPKDQRLSVVGLGKLGAPLLAVLAARGFNTIGIDKNQKFVESIKNLIAPVLEPQLQELLNAHSERISATTSLEVAIAESDATFVVVPTPSDENGRFSLRYAQKALEEIGHCLRKKNAWHLIVMTSTVMPGACMQELVIALEKTSNKTSGKDFGFCYSPEFIALGSVVSDLLNPDMCLIGEFDAKSGDYLADIYRQMIENEAPIKRMNIVNAEITKIALNSYVTMKISFANTLAEICEQFDGGNVEITSQAIGADSRVGTKYLKGALGFGGPCFPRDNTAFARMANDVGCNALLATATHEINDRQVARLSAKLASCVAPGSRIGVLGLAYKTGTPVVERSQGMEIAVELAQQGFEVTAFDSLAQPVAADFGSATVTVASSANACVVDCAAIVLALPEPGHIEATNSVCADKPVIVLDCWRALDPDTIGESIEVMAIGVNDWPG